LVTPTADYATLCGTLTYELIGGDTTYLTFDSATRTLTLEANLVAEVRLGFTHTIRAYGSLVPTNHVEITFEISITAPDNCDSINFLTLPLENEITVGETLTITDLGVLENDANGDSWTDACLILDYNKACSSDSDCWNQCLNSKCVTGG
jgi:hypothetical protein